MEDDMSTQEFLPIKEGKVREIYDNGDSLIMVATDPVSYTHLDVYKRQHYNRTYVSTLFKNTMGINFHDYLTRVRLSMAIDQLAVTEKNITQIAIDCGFSDLKTFNHRFRSVFGYLPAEYRQRLNPSRIMQIRNQQVYVSPRDPEVAQKLEEFLAVL